MVKPLSFKGDKKSKKRKVPLDTTEKFGDDESPAKRQVVAADTSQTNDDDSWVTAEAAGDLIGPILIVLPSEPSTCIACDQAGTVFTSVLENLVDGDPSTAEPHDVRQVWVVNKISGTEHYTLKGHHGKYLAVDRRGALSALHEAVSPLETFCLIPTADTPGTFQIQAQNSQTFLSVANSNSSKVNALPDIRGDADQISFNTTFRIRMQARFKPKLKRDKEEKLREKISRKELEEAVGRRLDDEEVKRLKKARREGDYHEVMLLFKVKNKHDKYS